MAVDICGIMDDSVDDVAEVVGERADVVKLLGWDITHILLVDVAGTRDEEVMKLDT